MASERFIISKIQLIDSLLSRRGALWKPTTYGLPDLMRPRQSNETVGEFRTRQDNELLDLLTKQLYILKDNVRIEIKLIPEMVRLSNDIVFKRQQRAIIKKPRGGGGSALVGALIFLCMIYHKKSFLNFSGSEAQSKIIYEYVRNYFKCFPKLEEALFDRDPITDTVFLKDDVSFSVKTASEKSARGKHKAGLSLDEAAQSDARTNDILEAAMQGPMSEPHHTVMLVSTMHLPYGVFFECILPEQAILTSDGIMPIENVKEGNSVIGAEGRLCKVQKVWNKPFSGKVRTIKTRGYGKGFSVTNGHGVLKANGIVNGPDSFEWVKAEELKVGDYLVVPMPKRNKFLKNYIEMESSRLNLTLSLNDSFYRWLGYWMGDGTVGEGHINYFAGMQDLWWMEDYKNLVSELFGKELIVGQDNKSENMIVLTLNYVPLANWLNKECKHPITNKKIMPQWLLERASKTNLHNFLVGLGRADGSLRKNSFCIGSSYQSIAFAISYSFLKLGIIPSLSEIEGGERVIMGHACTANKHYTFNVSDFRANKLIEDIYGIKHTFGKRRGYTSRGGYIYTKIKSIEEREYSGPVWDLTIENEHSFLLPWGMAHNTYNNAEEKGFERYEWDIIDAMKKCEEPFSCTHDGTAKPCPLTEKKPVYTPKGEFQGYELVGCKGRARNGVGFQTFQQVLQARMQNRNNLVWEKEYLCIPVEGTVNVYSPKKIDRAILLCPKDEEGFPYIPVDKIIDYSIGIDWGYSVPTAMCLIGRTEEYIAVLEFKQMPGQVVTSIASILDSWLEAYIGKGKDLFWKHKVPVYADAASPQSNAELIQLGFNVTGVPFGQVKDRGIENVRRYFEYERIHILPEFEDLIDSLKKYHYDEKGKIVKKDDHAVDALLCSLCAYRFQEIYGALEGMTGGLNDSVKVQRIG